MELFLYFCSVISKAKLKELAAYRLQKRLDEEELFIVEGPKMAAEALAAGADVVCVCATNEWPVASDQWPEGVFFEVSQAELERLSLMRAPNQVWMLVRRREVKPQPSPLTLALDRIQDPGNMGTIMRTADWYGVRHLVCSRDTVSCYNPKVVQASMGAVFRTRVEYCDLPQWLSACGMPVYGATLDGESIRSGQWSVVSGQWSVASGQKSVASDQRAVLLIGNEGRGISPEAMACVTRPVTIPNLGGTAESLNAAVAAAILIDRLLG